MENETGESLQQQLHEELKAVEDLDPALPGMTEPHQHQAHRTTEVEKLTRHRQVCACGAHRDAGLTISGAWVGGEKTSTPWERAHLGAVQRAVEGQQDLLQLQPGAIQDLHRALLNDPPPGAEQQDLTALAAVYRVALGASRRMLEWQKSEGGNQEAQ